MEFTKWQYCVIRLAQQQNLQYTTASTCRTKPGLLPHAGACWKGLGPCPGQGWLWTTGVTQQTDLWGLASLNGLQVSVSFRASLHLCHKEVNNAAQI